MLPIRVTDYSGVVRAANRQAVDLSSLDPAEIVDRMAAAMTRIEAARLRHHPAAWFQSRRTRDMCWNTLAISAQWHKRARARLRRNRRGR